jgi:hypothetical protein
VVKDHNLQGVDLDIEQPMELPMVTRLILRLKRDFGENFIITLAPVYSAMLPSNTRFLGLTRRLLNESDYPPADPLTAAVCRARNLMPNRRRNLSGFNHVDLERSEVGKLVSWYNVQMYCGWGYATQDYYDKVIDAGWKPERIVMGTVTSPAHGDGFQPVDQLVNTVKALKAKHGDKFGGLMGWEYYRSGSSDQPWEWVRKMGVAMGLAA